MASLRSPRVWSRQARMLFLAPTVQSGTERELTVDDFVSLSKSAIGEGAFSEVYKVRKKSSECAPDSQIYAIKVIKKSLVVEKQLTKQLEREVRILYDLNHPYIIKIITHFEDDRNVYVVMEYAPGGHMFKLLRKMREFDERTAAQYLRELVSALQYLHSRDPPIIHRDIKPENILLDAEGRSKLADFGWSNYSLDDVARDTYCGTLDYLAPEMVNRTGHTVKLDIWSLGVLLYEMLCGHAPFESKQKEVLFENIRKLKLKFPMTFPPLAKDLVRKLLRVNPEERITLEELLNHQWMRSIQPLRPLMQPEAPVQDGLISPRAQRSPASSPRGNRIKIVLSDPPISQPVHDRLRVVKQLQERLVVKQEEARKLREETAQLEGKLSDAETYIAAANRMTPVLQEKIERQQRRLAALDERLPEERLRLVEVKQGHKEAAATLSHAKLEHALLAADFGVINLMTRAIDDRRTETRKQTHMLHTVAGMKRTASLPKMGDMISAVCDFNRKLRSKPRTQSASGRKDRVPGSPKVTNSPLLTPRRLIMVPGLPLSARTTPKRIPRHKP